MDRIRNIYDRTIRINDSDENDHDKLIALTQYIYGYAQAVGVPTTESERFSDKIPYSLNELEEEE